MKYEIDARGKACPQPVVMTKNVLDTAIFEDVVEVSVDNEIAVHNLSRLANSRGCSFVSTKIADDHYLVKIGVKTDVAEGKAQEELREELPVKKSMVVVFSSDKMGEGDPELGHLLMKGFVYALTQQDILPQTMLFYNGGAKLTVEGSPCLEDLQSFASQGVEILTCGTCLNHYGLTEKLAVGTATNMYTIAEILSGAERVIRP